MSVASTSAETQVLGGTLSQRSNEFTGHISNQIQSAADDFHNSASRSVKECDEIASECDGFIGEIQNEIAGRNGMIRIKKIAVAALDTAINSIPSSPDPETNELLQAKKQALAAQRKELQEQVEELEGEVTQLEEWKSNFETTRDDARGQSSHVGEFISSPSTLEIAKEAKAAIGGTAAVAMSFGANVVMWDKSIMENDAAFAAKVSTATGPAPQAAPVAPGTGTGAGSNGRAMRSRGRKRSGGGYGGASRSRSYGGRSPGGKQSGSRSSSGGGASGDLPAVSSNGSSSGVPFGTSGLAANARAYGDFLLANYAGISSIGGVGQRPGPSDHPSGHAIDVMTTGAHGDAIAAQAVADFQAGRGGVKYVIWNRRIWSDSSPGGRPYTGRSPHTDHVHISFR